MTSLEMLALFGFVLLAYVSVVTAWLWARRGGHRGMAGKPEEDEQSDPPPPRGRTDASGLWVLTEEEEREEVPGRGRRTHPLYKKLASLSSDVSCMSRGQLKQRLKDLGLEPR